MASKKAPKGTELDNRKVQEIIGRAATDPKFVKRLLDQPTRALAEYRLDKPTQALVLRAIKLKATIDKAGAQIEADFGLKYQAV